MFNPSRLTFARQRRGVSKTKLAGQVGLTAKSIGLYESGDQVPSDATLKGLAEALEFPVTFFSDGSRLESVTPEGASFRSLSNMTASQRDSALNAGSLAIALSDWIDERFTLPQVNLRQLHQMSPEAAADSLRAAWGLGERPIKNMVHLLEAQGVRVFSLAQECLSVDAFSLWRDDVPYVFLNTVKSAERSRFDAAHELGHLVMHRHGGAKGRLAEQEADQFASAFLMPAGSVVAVAPRLPSLRQLVQLKRSWNVSLAALVYRLKALDLITEWHYRTLCIQLGELGYRKNEPNAIERESSQVLAKIFSVLAAEGTSRQKVAQSLHLQVKDLDALIFGLVGLTQVDGRGIRDTSSPRPKLTLHIGNRK